MKKIVISVLLLIVAGISIYLLNNRDDNTTVSKSNLTTKYTTEDATENTTVQSSVTSTETVSMSPFEDTSKDEIEEPTDKEKEGNEIQEMENINSGNVLISFFYAKDIRELIEWIKKADDNDPRKHFLDVVRQRKEILSVEAKNKAYKLESISVHPNYEYMSYTLKKDNRYIDILINLSDSMKQEMCTSKKDVTINEAVLEYNKELAGIYKDFRLKEGQAKISGTLINIFYTNGKYYEKLNGELKFIAPSAFFEYNSTEVRVNLYGDLKEEKWDNKYLDLFDFKYIQL